MLHRDRPHAVTSSSFVKDTAPSTSSNFTFMASSNPFDITINSTPQEVSTLTSELIPPLFQ